MDLPCGMLAIQYSPGKRMSGDGELGSVERRIASSNRLFLWRLLRTAILAAA
jgi:hypothetical protein